MTCRVSGFVSTWASADLTCWARWAVGEWTVGPLGRGRVGRWVGEWTNPPDSFGGLKTNQGSWVLGGLVLVFMILP